MARRHVGIDLDLLAKQAAGMTEDQLECRDMRHAWEAFTAKERRNGLIDETWRCSRGCGAFKDRTIDQMGRVIDGPHTRYTNEGGQGYLFKGLGRLDADANAYIRRGAAEARTRRWK